jgi:HPt (histidine-containing phosphotransfer) domain-containing protein
MPLDTQGSGLNAGCDSPVVWEFPEALRLLAECGDTGLVEELVAIFQADTIARLKVLGRAVAAGDLDVVRAEAHSIKGSALQVGAGRVAELCKQMEIEARKPAPQELFSLLVRTEQRFDEVCRAMAGPLPL